jgi:hypothetical protein
MGVEESDSFHYDWGKKRNLARRYLRVGIMSRTDNGGRGLPLGARFDLTTHSGLWVGFPL